MIKQSESSQWMATAKRPAWSPRPSSGHFGERLWARLPSDPATRRPMRLVGITSSGPGEGVSTIARGMALAAAERGGPAAALLIDLSSWKQCGEPSAEAAPGLSDVLAEGLEVSDAVQPSACEGLMLLPAGRRPVNCCDADQLQQLDKVLGDLRQQYDFLVIDLPCVAGSRCAAPLAALCDGALLVVQADAVDAGHAKQAVTTLRQAGVRIAGAVLNKQQDRLPRWMRRRT